MLHSNRRRTGNMRIAALALFGSIAASSAAHAQDAEAALLDPDGNAVGNVALYQTAAGVLIAAHFAGLPEGVHGFHIHQTGECVAPSFESAGGHYNPTEAEHGFQSQSGPHAGDMPNIHVPADGELEIEVLNQTVSLTDGEPGSLFDADGSAIVVHSGQDDYASQPSGDAGSRIACGTVERN